MSDPAFIDTKAKFMQHLETMFWDSLMESMDDGETSIPNSDIKSCFMELADAYISELDDVRAYNAVHNPDGGAA